MSGISIFILFIMFLIWAHGEDKKTKDLQERVEDLEDRYK